MRKTITIAMLFLLTGLVCGCAGMGGPTDEELIAKTLADWKAATEAEDLDGMMACISEDFQNEEGDKAGFREFVDDFIQQGALADAEMDLEDAITTVEGDSAIVEAVLLSSNMGSTTLDLEMQQDPDGTWRITGLEAY
jgi:ketosteroid isomerase-like protein